MDNWVHIICANIHCSSSIDHISNFQITVPSPNDNDEKVASSLITLTWWYFGSKKTLNEIRSTLPYLTTCSYFSHISLPIPFIKDRMWKKKNTKKKYRQNINVAINNKYLKPKLKNNKTLTIIETNETLTIKPLSK